MKSHFFTIKTPVVYNKTASYFTNPVFFFGSQVENLKKRHRVEHVPLLSDTGFWWMMGVVIILVTVVVIRMDARDEEPSDKKQASLSRFSKLDELENWWPRWQRVEDMTWYDLIWDAQISEDLDIHGSDG